MIAYTIFILQFLLPLISGFVTNASTKSWTKQNQGSSFISGYEPKLTGVRSGLNMGLFDDIMDMFSGEPKNVEVSEFKRLMTIEVTSMKAGGLRFALGLHLMGLQGKPERGTWKTKQADDDIVDMFHKSDTGSLAFTFQERQIIVERWGPFPSKEYLTDESVVLHEFLDELVLLTSGGDVEEADRLLALKDPNSLENARKALLLR